MKRILKVDEANVLNEQIVLSSMMKSGRLRKELSIELKAAFFIAQRHRTIFRILKNIAKENLKFAIETFAQMAGDSNFGGLEYLETLKRGFPKKSQNIKYHIQVLKRDAVKNYLRVKAVQELTNVLENPHSSLVDVGKIVLRIRDIVKTMEERGFVFNSTEVEKEYLDDFQERLHNTSFQPTYFKALDEILTEGLARKKVSIWTGRPGMGKTTFAANVARRLAFHNISTLVCPIEGSKIPFVDLMIAGKTGIELERLIKLTNTLTHDEKDMVSKTTKKVMDHRVLDFVDSPGLNLDKLEMVLQNREYAVCIIDLFEKMMPDLNQSTIALALNRVQGLAKEYNIHFALLHQIRRGVEKRTNKRPRMEDLKNSGGYEEVADLILGFYREKYYNQLLEEDIFEVLILKQRRGIQNKRVAFEYDPSRAKIGKYRGDRSEGVRLSDLYG